MANEMSDLWTLFGRSDTAKSESVNALVLGQRIAKAKPQMLKSAFAEFWQALAALKTQALAEALKAAGVCSDDYEFLMYRVTVLCEGRRFFEQIKQANSEALAVLPTLVGFQFKDEERCLLLMLLLNVFCKEREVLILSDTEFVDLIASEWFRGDWLEHPREVLHSSGNQSYHSLYVEEFGWVQTGELYRRDGKELFWLRRISIESMANGTQAILLKALSSTGSSTIRFDASRIQKAERTIAPIGHLSLKNPDYSESSEAVSFDSMCRVVDYKDGRFGLLFTPPDLSAFKSNNLGGGGHEWAQLLQAYLPSQAPAALDGTVFDPESDLFTAVNFGKAALDLMKQVIETLVNDEKLLKKIVRKYLVG